MLNSRTGREVCRRFNVSTEFVFAVAVTMASFAERSTGRRVCASRDTIARRSGVSVSVVKRARRALRTLSVAREMVRGRYLRADEAHAAESHHGRIQRRAASVWALMSPKSVVIAVGRATKKVAKKVRRSNVRSRSTYPQLIARGPLSPSRGFKLLSLVRELSPKRARARAGEQPKNAGIQGRQPRPIELQRTAADLLFHAPVFASTAHIGSVCEVLASTGVDGSRWSGRDIAAELTRDTQQRGWVWPQHIENPVGYLRWRMKQIDWTRPSPSEMAQKAAQEARQRIADRDARLSRRDRLVSSPGHRQRCRQAFAAAMHDPRKGGAQI
ncbi:replication protein [Rhodococcus opacus]|nr:replication protein [Rhodococcus opacus]